MGEKLQEQTTSPSGRTSLLPPLTAAPWSGSGHLGQLGHRVFSRFLFSWWHEEDQLMFISDDIIAFICQSKNDNKEWVIPTGYQTSVFLKSLGMCESSTCVYACV